MKNKSILLALFLLPLLSCNNHQSVYVIGKRVVSSSPKIEKVLTPVSVLDKPDLLGALGLVFATDSALVISTNKTGYVFRVINLKDYETLDLLPVGRGPDEAVIGAFSGIRKEEGKTLLDVTALNEECLLSIDLDASIKAQRTVVVDKENLLPESWLSFFVKKDILSMVIADEDLYSFKLYSRDDHRIQKTEQVFGNDPFVVDFQPQFESVRRIKPDQTKLCMMMGRFDEVNILDLDGSNHLSISLAKKRREDAKIISAMLSGHELTDDVYYWNGCVTDEEIYGLYYGCSSLDMDNVRPTIRVFSWEGVLRAIYHLEEPLTSIALAEDGHTLYGLTEEEVLYRYDLRQ